MKSHCFASKRHEMIPGNFIHEQNNFSAEKMFLAGAFNPFSLNVVVQQQNTASPL